MMDKNDTDKTVENESCLKVSDWITFLTSESNSMLSNVVSFGAFLVAIIAILLVGGENSVIAISGGIVALGCVGFAYFRVLKPLGQRGKLAGEIVERVMSGKLKTESSIREEWEGGLAALKRARHRRGSSDK